MDPLKIYYYKDVSGNVKKEIGIIKFYDGVCFILNSIGDTTHCTPKVVSDDEFNFINDGDIFHEDNISKSYVITLLITILSVTEKFTHDRELIEPILTKSLEQLLEEEEFASKYI